MDMRLMHILMGKFRGDERGMRSGMSIKNSSRKQLSVVKDGKDNATTHMNELMSINIPNSEQVIEDNLPICEILEPLDLNFTESIRDCVKKTLNVNGPEVEHTKNSIENCIAVRENRQDSIMQTPRSMQVNIIIPNSDFISPRCEVCQKEVTKESEESPYQAASGSECKNVCILLY